MTFQSRYNLVQSPAGIFASASFMPSVVSYTTGNIIGTAQEFAFTFFDAKSFSMACCSKP